MSGESGMPKKHVHDFTCQVSCEPPVFVPNGVRNAPPAETARIPIAPTTHLFAGQSEHSAEELKKLYMERLWAQQTTAVAPAFMHREEDYRWPLSSALRHYLVQANAPSDPPALPVPPNGPTIPIRNGEDRVLESLKHLHAQRFFPRGGDAQEHSLQARMPPRELPSAMQQAERDCVQVVATSQDRPHDHEAVSGPRSEQASSQARDAANGFGHDAEATAAVGGSQQRYLCRICERTFCDLYNLVAHAKMFHSSIPELIFVCNFCKLSFEDASSLHGHLKSHGDLGFFAGAACQLKRPSNQTHQRLVHQRRFPCPECGKMFSRFGFMQSHIERVHGSSHLSASMDTTALSKDTMVCHEMSPVNGQTGEEPSDGSRTHQKLYKCLDCNDQFDDVEVFQQHIREMHLDHESNSISAPPPLTEDMNVTIEPRRSKSEELTSPGKETFACQECGKEFPRGKLLQNHVNSHHISANVCQENFPPSLTDGAESNEAQGPFPPNAEGNREHAGMAGVFPKQHNGNALANGFFKREAPEQILDLTVGSGIENASSPASDDSNEKPEDTDMNDGQDHRARRKRFVCDVCGKTYKYGFHMKEHRLTHAAVCPFVCRICGMGFFRQRQLRDHELRHTGAYPCRCEICGKGFPRTSELKRHLAFRHRRLDIFARQNSVPSPPDDGR